MVEPPVDLRSDTVTRPTPAMWEAMRGAEVGDDVLGDDPTVLALQDRVAALLGKEAACFVPSGSMANQAAIGAQTRPGDQIVAHRTAHVYHYESGAPAALSGCSMRFVDGPRGIFGPEDLEAAINPDDHHFPPTALVVIENTSNEGGGAVWPVARIDEIGEAARRHGLRVHMDGARLWNAAAATGSAPADIASAADTVSVCFSKGLGAPVGSAVAGDCATVRRAHRLRKMFGGAMRQSGLLAAAALHALDHHLVRLRDDHLRARRLAGALHECAPVSVDLAAVETNIVFFGLDPAWGTGGDAMARLESAGVRLFDTGPQRCRAVTHMDVDDAMIERACERFREVLR